MSVLIDIVVSNTLKKLQAQIVDSAGNPISLVSATQAPVLEGRSTELTTPTINKVGTITDAPNGRVEFTNLGGLVSHAQLAAGNVTQATYKCRIKYFTSAAFDWGDEIQLRFVDTPLGT